MVRKITIKGAYGATNFGDDLLMCLFEKYFLDGFGNVDLNFEGMYNLDYPNKMLKEGSYNESNFVEDWYIFGGGTQFFAFDSKKKSFKEIVSILFLSPNKVINKVVKLIKKSNNKDIVINGNVAFLGFGLGPFYNPAKIPEVKKVLSKANFIGVRDKVSYNYCNEWGIKASFGADIAYSSYFDYRIESNTNTSNLNINTKKRKVGLVVRDWVWEETGQGYIKPIMELYRQESENYEFQFIIFAPYKDPKWMKRLEGENILYWNPNEYSIQSFLEILNSFDIFITARFHGAIIGALLGKPVIAVEIEPKLQILTEDVKEILLWKQPFELKELKNLLEQINMEVCYEDSLLKLKKRSDNGLEDFRKVFLDSYSIQDK
ncbi:polysaccharide pyruvyl transferase family protein [Zhouia sp. PK063]|uniref:polysaccharide pyruvyl transferase family protein n=1 Tax=Zhouia sp. PK063 TaxID=3373602 RepID=UPI003795C713